MFPVFIWRKFCTILLLVLFLVHVACALKTISTSYGSIRGITRYDTNGNHKYMFKGVPFSRPPIGNLRFALPQEPYCWSDTLDATKYSAACMSNSSQTSTPQSFISEDCLYINIFTSEKCMNEKCPVIVYYHGGAFNLDSATMFPDDFILERYVDEDVVFAIPAFRLGVFGQLYFGPESTLTENLILFDVVQSLNFVHNEIFNFGGDPNRVTMMGHSTGGTIVDSIGFSSLVDPDLKLFQKMIVLSAPGMYEFYDLVVDNSFEFVRQAGCWNGTVKDRENANVPEILKCLREINANDLLEIQRKMEEDDEESRSFRGIIRGAPFMKFDQKIADFKKKVPPRKVLYGVTEHEFRNVPVPHPFIQETFLDWQNPLQVHNHFNSLLLENYDTWVNANAAGVFITASTFCETLVKSGGTAYLFETRQKPYSFHVSDMQYFIGIHREVYHFKDMDILDEFYSELLVNFTKYDEPSPEWDKFDAEKMNFLALEIDSKRKIGPQMKDGFHETERKIWLHDLVEYDDEVTSILREFPEFLPSEKTVSSVKLFDLALDRESSQNEYDQNTRAWIFEQWWFYITITMAGTIMAITWQIVKTRRQRVERTPLMA